jgi:UV DNA damage endonuclease
MRLGFAVKALGEGGLPSHDTRRWQSGPHLRSSIEALHAIFDYLERVDVDMYRMTASLAPYATHPEIGRRPGFAHQVEDCAAELAELGARAGDRGLRLSTHPGQYVVLNSEDADVRAGAVRDVELQAALLDAMGLGPEAVVVLHVGGAAGGFDAAMARFEAGFERLSDRARDRLAIENDDRTFGLCHVMELRRRTGLKVVWDILHHHCNDPEDIPDREALELALSTWPAGVRPKIHYSTPKTAMEERRRKVGRRVERSWVLPQLRAHADVIDPIGFEHFLREVAEGLDFDVMLEAKAKELALLRLREQVAARGIDLRPRATPA